MGTFYSKVYRDWPRPLPSARSLRSSTPISGAFNSPPTSFLPMWWAHWSIVAKTIPSMYAEVRFSPTSSWPTKSTARRPKCKVPYCRPCKSDKSPSATTPCCCPTPSLCWPPKTPSNKKAPTRCPKHKPIALCSKFSSTTRASKRNNRSCVLQ